MKQLNRNQVIFVLIIYLVLYMTSLFAGINRLSMLLKPWGAFLAYLTYKIMTDQTHFQQKMKKFMCAVFFCWFVTDMLNPIGILLHTYLKYDGTLSDNVRCGLLLVSRILLLLFSFEIYYLVTRKTNRFLIITDILTISLCSVLTFYLTYIIGSSGRLTAERMRQLMHWNIRTGYVFFYAAILLGILGILLITWFQLQYGDITAAVRLVILGIAGVAEVDLFRLIFITRSDSNIIFNLIYAVSLLLITAGGLLCGRYPIEFNRVNMEQLPRGWKNSCYLLCYPLFNIITYGYHELLLIYIFIIAYYNLSGLYTRQISVTDSLLKEEKKYSEKLKLYSNVIEQVPLSVLITDVAGRVLYINPYFTKSYGYTMEEIKGKRSDFMRPKNSDPQFYEDIYNAVRTGEKWSGELFNLNKVGEENEESAVILPIKEEDNQIINYVAIMDNISETKAIQKQLSNQCYFTSQLLDSLPCAVYYTDTEGVFLGMNLECKKEYGVYSDALYGTKLSEAFWMDGESFGNFQRMTKETLSTNRPSICQIRRSLADGRKSETLYSISAFYLADGTVGGYLGVMTDVTDLKQKEEALKEALKHANEAAEAKSQFLANMSHEIRTPMNAIIGMSYLALQTELNQKQTDYITKIHNAATSLLEVINDILDFTKIESGKLIIEKIEFSLSKVITDSIELFIQKAYEKGLELLYRLPARVPDILIGDPLRIGQILNNLIGNAVKFTQSGEIFIDVSIDSMTSQQVLLKFSVSDTGIGIQNWNRERLFEAFTQSDSSTTREYGGTGLGLAICRRLTELMGGSLWVESEYGKGSIFYLQIDFEYREDNSTLNTGMREIFQKMKILVADDNQRAGEILSEYLNVFGFKTERAGSGEEALRKILNNTGDQYQIAFLDWNMAGMSGIETALEIRKHQETFFKPSIVLVTEFDMEDKLNSNAAVSVEGYITKPVSKTALYQLITSLFALNLEALPNPSELSHMSCRLPGIYILLVEDNEINQQIVTELLNAHGVNSDIVNNGLEAVEKIKHMNSDSRYDLILMDLQMPVMDGFEAAKLIHGMKKDIPVIALTARTMAEERDKCFQNGIIDVIAKPIDPDSFFATIMKWVDPDNLKLNINYTHTDAAADYDLRIDGIDTQAGLKRVSYKVPLYLKLLSSFAKDQRNILYQMKAALEKEDYAAIERLSHSLKGLSGNLGAVNMQELSADMEQLVRTKAERKAVFQLFISLCKEANRIIHSINLQMSREDTVKKVWEPLPDIEIIWC